MRVYTSFSIRCMPSSLLEKTGKQVSQIEKGDITHIADTHENESEVKLALDIFETADELIFLAPLSGVYIEEVEVLVTEDVLTISGTRVFPDDIVPEKSKAFLEECYWGKFSRSIVLPSAVNSEDATAEFIRGILTIHVPKAKKAKSKSIPIQVV